MKKFVKIEYSEFDETFLENCDFIGEMDSIMPIAELKDVNNFYEMMSGIADVVGEEGLMELYIIVNDDKKTVKVYTKKDIYTLLNQAN